MKNLKPKDKATLDITINENPYIPHEPFCNQVQFLLAKERELLYGGAAGGGKSDALLMGALQYVESPQYNSLIIRRTYADLAQEGALMERAHEWLDNTDAKWNDIKKRWKFPSGATLSFNYMDNERQVRRIQGTNYHYIAVDELTQIPQQWWQFLSRSLRKADDDTLPLRKRAASNPGDIGHEWVKREFIKGNKKFIPSNYKDNPHINQDEYEISLDELDHITRQQLKKGDWDINPEGGLFKRSWFNIIDTPPQDITKSVRAWDLAATVAKPGTDPDYTVGLKLGMDKDRNVYVLDVRRLRASPKSVEDTILTTARLDGTRTHIRMEQEGGATGKIVIDDYNRKLMGYPFKGKPAKKSKEERAKPVSSYAENGLINVLNKNWTIDFLDEIESFKTEGIHDDQVDALSLAFSELIKNRTILKPRKPRRR